MNKIKFLRQSRRMTQEELAEVIGVSPRQYQRFEKGNATLKAKHLAALAKVLKCEIHELFGGRPTAPTFNSHGSAAKQAQVLAENFAFVSKLLNAPPDYQYLVGALLDDDPDQLDHLSPKFVEKLRLLLSSL